MKLFAPIAFIAATLAALAIATPPAAACDYGVAALGTGCYSQNIRQRVKIVERQVEPVYVEKIVQRVEVPVYVQRVEKVQRVKVIERQRSYPLRSSLRSSLSVPARVVERISAPRARVIRRERVVERSVY